MPCGEFLAGLFERQVDVAADIFFPDQVVEPGLFERAVNGRVYAGENDLYAFPFRHSAQVGQVMNPRRVDERDFPHPDNADLRVVAERDHLFFELAIPKKKGPSIS